MCLPLIIIKVVMLKIFVEINYYYYYYYITVPIKIPILFSNRCKEIRLKICLSPFEIVKRLKVTPKFWKNLICMFTRLIIRLGC